MSVQLDQLKEKQKELHTIFLRKRLKKEQLETEITQLQSKVDNVNISVEIKEKSAELLRRLGTKARKQAKENVELMVTNALQFVFEEDLEFVINYDEKRGRPEADFLIVSNFNGTKVELPPEDSRGGGISDVVSVTLRIALAELFGVKGPMVLDEPTKHLSKRFTDNFAMFLRQISEQFNRQFILISHNLTLAEFGNKSYLVEEINGVSKVTLVETERDITEEENNIG